MPSTTPDVPAYIEPLTERELEALAMACRGPSARGIGHRLFISEHTVESHVSNTHRKLGIRSRIELVRLAVYFGFRPCGHLGKSHSRRQTPCAQIWHSPQDVG
ncbi:helix-turn-helix transcriptional regulator [Mycobacterium sp.]|uniref:response regulator transcription factor n=1 Tax=Mycobacterium sp. TaxID=1785 RepID=UPI0034507E9A